MLETIGHEEPPKAEILLGLLGYYEAILNRKGLAARIGEVKSIKLGMILDLVRITDISEELREELNSTIIHAWNMKCQGSSYVEAEDDIHAILKNIKELKQNVLAKLHSCNPNEIYLDSAVMLTLPLRTKDLISDEVPIIRDILEKVMKDLLGRKKEAYACA